MNKRLIRADFMQEQMCIQRMYCKSKLRRCMAFVLTRPMTVLQKPVLFQLLPRSDSKRFLAAEMSEDEFKTKEFLHNGQVSITQKVTQGTQLIKH